jgi:hypothetical protein
MAESLGEDRERWCIVLVVVQRDGSLVLVVEPTRQAAPCPKCGERSRRQHSRYERSPLDLPRRGYAVRLRVHTAAGSVMRRPARAKSSPNVSMASWGTTLVAPTAPPT